MPIPPFSSGAKSRRQFLRTVSQAAGVLAATSLGSLRTFAQAKVEKKTMGERKLGIALLGLGSYSTGQLAPALLETKFCSLAGIVTGTPSKVETWTHRYDLPAKCIYNYENFDRMADNPAIDIVY